MAQFLMRCLFTMFAEDVNLLPENLFIDALEKTWIPHPEKFPAGIEILWRAMNVGGDFGIEGKIKHFNGGLFVKPTSLPLTSKHLALLHEAARCDWSDVEPAIFGTLLEQALEPKERHSLGAHYTPRAYVERLVRPTIEEPLRIEWDVVQAEVRSLVTASKLKDAVKSLRTFHHRLTSTRVLDPACGSGNFLYVALDVFKRLESEVLALLRALGEQTDTFLDVKAIRVTPAQFLGIEIKPWAKEIAELVLWIGYLQWHFRTSGKTPPREPILENYQNIDCRDALLSYDRMELLRDEKTGKPITHWDGETFKKSSITGEDIPDESARASSYRYINPKKAEWPDAEFIVGNPPFIGTGLMRAALGDGYTDALRETYADVPESADFVMYWWEKAALKLQGTGTARRFGLITTKAIGQTFNRRVVEAHLYPETAARKAAHLLFAVPNHPWVDSGKGAQVRIAMTVVALDDQDGILSTVEKEGAFDGGSVDVTLRQRRGLINANLTIGANVASAVPLKANFGICSPGVKLHGAGFIVTPKRATELGLGRLDGVEEHVRPYRNGKDLAAKSRGVLVIDMFGLPAERVRERFPDIYQHLLQTVKPGRDAKRDGTKDSAEYAKNWWVFGKPRSELRRGLRGLPRFISTGETSKHRYFVFLDASILPDNMLINIAMPDAAMLGVLSSRIHVLWALKAGARLGVGDDPRYTKSRCFDPFPFPLLDEVSRAKIDSLAETLDAHRKRQQEQHQNLSMTGMYNVLEKLRLGSDLDAKDRAIHDQGLVSVLKQIHDDLDAAVFDAYGWPSDLTDEQILDRLVALNAERADEERKGVVRWLRPEFQNPGDVKMKGQIAMPTFVEDQAPVAATGLLPWPKRIPEQVTCVRDLLLRSRSDWGVEQVSKSFKGAKRTDVETILESLAALGLVVSYATSAGRRWRSVQRAVA